jgi:hypothetical protein
MMTWLCQCDREIPDHIPVCGQCLMDRPSAPHEHASACDECHTPSRVSQLTPASWDPKDDDARPLRWRCASCHIEYLRRRMLHDPISPEDLARCKARIQDAIARAGAKWQTQRPDKNS